MDLYTHPDGDLWVILRMDINYPPNDTINAGNEIYKLLDVPMASSSKGMKHAITLLGELTS